MSHWTMQNNTGSIIKVEPSQFWHWFKQGYRPVADRATSTNDYQTTKRGKDERTSVNR